MAKRLSPSLDNTHLEQLARLQQLPLYARFKADLLSPFQPEHFTERRPAQALQRLNAVTLLPFYKILSFHYETNLTVVFHTDMLPVAKRGIRDNTITSYIFAARRLYFPDSPPLRVENPAPGYHRVLSTTQLRYKKRKPRAALRDRLAITFDPCEKEDLLLALTLLSKKSGTVELKHLTTEAQKIIDQVLSGFRSIGEIELNKTKTGYHLYATHTQ